MSITALVFAFSIVTASASSAQTNVASYGELRSTPCQTGAAATITTGRFAGTFTCRSRSNPLRSSDFDDGGLQFLSGTQSNFWIRDFGHSEADPIDLGWYEWISEGARVDTLIKNLAGDFGGDLFVRSPDVASVNKLNWPSWIDLTGDITGQFKFLQSSKLVIYQKLTVSSTAYQDSVAFLSIDSGDDLYIGGPHPIKMEFRGHDNFDRPQHSPSTETTSRPGMADALSFYGCGEEPGSHRSVEVRVNVTQPLGGSIGVGNSGCGNSVDWDNVTFAGRVESAFRMNNGFTNGHLDSLIVEDPWGLLYGFDGTAYPDNNDRTMGYKQGGTSRVQKGSKVTGKMVMARGSKFFMASMDQVGNSQSDPFIVEYKDNCWSGADLPGSYESNTRIDWDGFRQDTWKMDGIGSTGRYWFRVYRNADDALGMSCKDGTFNLEASKDGNTIRNNTGVYIEAGNLQPGAHSGDRLTIDTWQGDGGITTEDVNERHTIVGLAGMPNLGEVRMVDQVTLHSGVFEDITIEKASAGQGRDNTVRDVTLTGAIDINGGIAGTTLRNVTWSGQRREVVNISSGADVTVPSDGKLTAPAGSTIGGSGTLICSGRSQSLPYTFDGVTDDCEGESSGDPPPSNSPPSASFSAVPDPTGGSLAVDFDASASSDSDGSIVQYSWDFGDGSTSNGGVSTTHTYGSPGVYTVVLAVTDDGGLTDVDSKEVQVLGSNDVVSFQQGSAGYSGARDAMIRADASATNHGSAVDLQVDGEPDAGVLLAWNLSSIPLGSTVSSATIELDVTNVTTVGSTYYIYRSLRGWVESEATWTSFASGQNWQSPGAEGVSDRGTQVLGQLQPLSTGNYQVSLNAAGVNVLQSWVDNPQSNNGLILSNYDGATDSFVFSSKEAATVGDRPKLTVMYEPSGSPPPPPPPSSDSQSINLVEGWNLVSSYVEPANSAVESMLASIVDDVVLVKDQDGNLYSPEFGINTIGNWQPLEAYQFNVRQPASLVIEGESTADNTPIALRQGWNMIPVLLTQAFPVEECLFSISDQLVVAKDNLGQIYNPEFGINTIGDFVPGQGYNVYVNPTATLNYSVRGKR